MALLAPAALLFAGLFLPVLAMYFIRQRREAVVLPTIALWARFVRDPVHASRWHRFRGSLLLLLQLLLMLALILALARPFAGGAMGAAERQVIILDASASMLTREDDKTRFAQAKAEIGEHIDALSGGRQLMLVAAGPRPWVAHALTGDKRRLHRALAALECTGGRSDLAAAMRVAVQAAGGVEPPVVRVWTDGAGSALEGVDALDMPVQWHRAGRTGDNVGVTALAVRRRPDSPLDLEIFASLANTGARAHDVAVTVHLDQTLLHYSRRTLSPGAVEVITEPLLAGRTGIVRVHVDVKDALALDNDAALVLAGQDVVRVLLVTQGNALLQRALQLMPAVEVTVVSPRDVPRGYAGADVLVLDRWLPLRWPDRPALVLGPPRGSPLEHARLVRAPRIAAWRRDHALLRYLSFADVHVDRALVHPPAPGVTPLVSTTAGTLVWTQRGGGARHVVVGFPLSESDWIFRPSFPLFLANMLESVRADSAGSPGTSVRAGDTLRVALPVPAPEASVRYPDGTTADVAPRDGYVYVDDTRQVGLYTVRAGRWSGMRAVNLLDADESTVAPQPLPDNRGGVTRRAGIGLARELWPWLVGLALGLSLLEWTVYHRKAR